MIRKLIGYTLAVLAFCAAALPLDARAAAVNGGFALPTTYCFVNPDGSDDCTRAGAPLPVANIKHIRIEVGTCTATNAFGIKEGEALVPPPTLTYTVTVPRAFGKFCARGQTETQLGTLSPFTLAVWVNVNEPTPRPPVLATPTVAAVFELVPDRWEGVRLGRNVGWVDAGTKCLNNSPVSGWYEVENVSDVHLTKQNPKSSVLVTKCEWT